MFKRLFLLGAFCSALISTAAETEVRKPEISTSIVEVRLDEGNSFQLKSEIETFGSAKIKLIGGDLCLTASNITSDSGSFWERNPEATISYDKKYYYLNCPAKGKYKVDLNFICKVKKDALMRSCSFYLLPSLVRKINLVMSPLNVDPKIYGCISLNKSNSQDSKSLTYTGTLQASGKFSMLWKRLVDSKAAALAVNAEVYSAGSVLTGAVKINTKIIYKIFQGSLKQLKLRVPKGLNILAIKGKDILDWEINKQDAQQIIIELAGKQNKDYVLEIQAEQILAETPCTFSLHPIIPENVMRLDGSLRFGSGRGVKLLVENTSGLVQIDNNSFYKKQLPEHTFELLNPLSYNFSSGDYELSAKVENISPSYSVNMNCIANCTDRALNVRFDCELDIKDAPLRELSMEYEPGLTFSRVIGRQINPQDYDLETENKLKKVKISFREPVFGKVTFSIYFERELKEQNSFNIPNLKIEGAKSVRGYLLLAADRGLKLLPGNLQNLTPVHPGSLPIRQALLQFSYLFRNPDWNGKINIEHIKGNIISEIFNLISAGEGTAYGSSIISFHISGAPVDNLRFVVGDDMKNLEFKGSDIISRKQTASAEKGFSIWEVKLRKKRLGDITMLATYEMSIKDGGTLRLGAISALDSDFSSSYIALSGVKSLKVSSAEAAPSVQEIDQSELPVEYLQMINNPLLKVYRGGGGKQWQDVKISSYRKCAMPQTVIDRTEISTRFDANGDSVTTVQYRIKNSTGQFLSLKLPEKSDLWKVKVNDRSKRLSISDGRVLIPLPRHRNINMPIAIEVVYAQKFDSIDHKSKVVLSAPQSEIKSLFCNWLVSVPDNCAIISSDPEPVKRREAFAGGFAGILERISFYATTRTGIAFMIGWFLTTIVGCWFFFCCARNHKVFATLSFLIGAFVAFVSSVVMVENLSRSHLGSIHSFIVNQATFTRVMGLDGKAFTLDLVIKNMETATMWSSIYSLISIVAAVAAFLLAKILKRRFIKALCIGAGCTLIVFAISQWFRLSIYAGFILALGIPLAFSFALWLATWRKFRIGVTAIITAVLLLSVPADAKKRSQVKTVETADNGIIIENVVCTGSTGGQKPSTETNVNQGIHAQYEFTVNAEKPGKIELFSSPIILASFPEPTDEWNIIRDSEKYILVIKEKCEFKISMQIEAPIIRKNGKQTFSLPVQSCLKNSFTLTEASGKAPAAQPELESRIKALNAISMRRDHQTLKAVFVPGTTALFEISEKVQDVKGAALTFFAKTTSYVNIGRGSTEIIHGISLNIPQGSLKVLNLKIPANSRVTSVTAIDLEAWRFDRQAGTLKIFFSKPQSNNYRLSVNCQIPNGKLPRSISIAPLKLSDADKQYGSFGIFVSQEVKINEGANKNFTPVNNSFFTNTQMGNALLKKTFRYASTDADLALKISEVKPELRVNENVKVNFEDERITLDSELMLNIIKGGIFSVKLQVPEGFEVNRLTGNNIQHWDEIKVDGGNQIVINFEKRLSGRNSFNISLSKMISENYKNALIPAIRVVNAHKHTGTLSINVEKGTTISIIKRSGVTVSTEKSRFNNNGSDFKILRPDWSLKVAFAVTPPWIQLKTLQNINIKAHNIECNTFFNYSIENAGVKRFRVTLPSNCAAPEFSGRYIRSAGKLKDNTWGIELDRKVEHSYRLKIRCQLKLNEDKTLSIKPFVSPESGIQTGYVVLFAEDSLQLKTVSSKGELTNFNSRNIPALFGAKNLSNAILCYRTVGKDCSAKIEIISHQNAATLKASVDSVSIKSLIAESGQVLSKATLTVSNNNETFLPLKLPEGCTLWAAFVDSSPVEAVKNGDMSLIPLKQDTSTGTCTQNVQFIYSSASTAEWTPRNQDYQGPLFGLPLKNIKWEVFLPENHDYSDFGGTLNYRNELFSALAVRTINEYDTVVQNRVRSEAGKAKELFSLGRSYIKKGYNKKAFAVLNEANSFTGDKALQSDIQGQQLINSRLQNVYNMSKRRSSIAQSTSVAEPQKQQQEKSNDMQALRQQMGDEELKNLQSISDKIFMQQQAAASTPRLFDISIPWKGKKITFERALEIRKDAPLNIKFKSAQKLRINSFSTPLLFAGLILVFTIISALAVRKSEEQV